MAELSPKDQKLLWGRAHNACAFPRCRQRLIEEQVDAATGSAFPTVVGEGAHIRSASASGPRYDPGYPAERLETYDNRILLCGVHHTLVDSQSGRGYTADDLIGMKVRHEQQRTRLEKVDLVLRRYLADQFEQDDPVLFRQVDLDGPSVDLMFVDVPFACRSGDPAAGLLSRIATDHPGDIARVAGYVATGAAQALLHPAWFGNALLVGGPGQGKSTLLQFVCQFHRGRYLQRDSYSGDAHGLRPVTEVVRVPLRLDLRSYAAWARRVGNRRGRKGQRNPVRTAQGGDEWPTLEQYIVDHVASRTGGFPFDIEDLAIVLSTSPVLLALDGLDEVADLVDRDHVADEVLRTTARLSTDAHDLVVLVASRPGVSESRLWSSTQFPAFHLQRLTAGLRLQYLQRWCAVSKLSSPAAEQLQRTFLQHEHAPHIRDLASYPMQLAILLHLLYRRGLLPQQRTDLYSQYLQTFLDREATEDKEPLVSRKRDLIVDVHSFLGWYLQVSAENGDTSGKVARTAVPGLLAEHLGGRQQSEELASQIFNAINSRVLCLVERESGYLEFEVPSLREYFAASYLNEYTGGRGPRTSKVECFDALLARPYWLNVCRFFVGMFNRMEVRGISESLTELAAQPPLSVHPHLRTAAARLLDDRTMQGQPDTQVRAMVDFIFDGPGVVLAEDGMLDDSGQRLTLSEDAGRSQAVEHLQDRLLTDPADARDGRRAAAAALSRHAPQAELRQWWWDNFSPDRRWLATAADLGALEGAEPVESRLADAVLNSLDDPTAWASEILAAGNWDGNGAGVLRSCLSEVEDGAAEVVPHSASGPLGQLVWAAGVAQLRPVPARTAWPSAAPELEHLSPTLNLAAIPDDSDPRVWAERLRAVFSMWGDSWVTGQAVAAVPARVSLRGVAAEINDACLAASLRREDTARTQAADLDWWQAEWNDAVTPLAQRRWLISVLSRARPAVLVALAAPCNEAVAALSPRRFRSVSAALRVSQGLSTARQVNLREELRLSRFDPSPRASWLLRIVATEATRDQINKRLAGGYAVLLAPGMDERAKVIQLAGESRSIPVERLENTRDVLGANSPEPPRLGAMTFSTSERILSAPDRWPAAVVARAAQKQSERLKRVPTIAAVVASRGWFLGI